MTTPGHADVLIVEANMTGHRPYYVRLLVEGALLGGQRVVVASSRGPRGFGSADAALHLSDLSGQHGRVEIDEVTPLRVGELSRSLGTALTIVPDGDRFALNLALSRGWSGAGALSVLIMREVAQPAKLPGVQAAKTLIRSALFRRVDSFSNVRVAVLKAAWWSGDAKLAVARDPITLHCSSVVEERLRDEWELDRERYWFAILGAISRRKNIDVVAKSLRGVEASKVGFLVAGAWDESVGDETTTAIDDLRNHGARVVVINRRLQDNELDAAVVLADCVVLAHSNEGPSGLLGKAAAAGTRVVAAGARSLREDLIRLPELGVWVRLEESELTQACSEALTCDRPYRQWGRSTDEFARALL